MTKAVEHYTGDFLTGFYRVDSSSLEEWMLAKREELRHRALAMREHLIHHHEACTEYEQARQYAHRQSNLDPLSEESHRSLMRLLALSGRRSEALGQYFSCRQLLVEELGVETAPQTIALYEVILANQTPTSAAGHTSWHYQEEEEVTQQEWSALPDIVGGTRIYQGEMPEPTLFFGREAEQAKLIRWLTTVVCRVVAVLGMGGVRKTNLAAKVVMSEARPCYTIRKTRRTF